jgi:hypothetical protein
LRKGESTASSVADIPLPPGPLPPLPGETPPPKQEVKTTYEAAPILRDLRKEAAAFVPVAVKRKLEAQKALRQGEEAPAESEGTEQEGAVPQAAFIPRVNAAPEVDVDEELRRFNVEVEAVEDDGR